MKYRLWACLLGGLLIGFPGEQRTLADVVPPPGVEVLGRGPVHEAFAQPLEQGEPAPGPIAPKPPPPPPEEQPPAQKPEGDRVQWVPGYWQWDDQKGEFNWVTGTWRRPP